jgi:hypothetical protein
MVMRCSRDQKKHTHPGSKRGIAGPPRRFSGRGRVRVCYSIIPVSYCQHPLSLSFCRLHTHLLGLHAYITHISLIQSQSLTYPLTYTQWSWDVLHTTPSTLSSSRPSLLASSAQVALREYTTSLLLLKSYLYLSFHQPRLEPYP